MSPIDPSSPEFFEAKYQRTPDPWNFAGSEYEQRRYSAVIAALRSRRYRHAFEPGCSVGVLTEQLAAICDRVEAIDFSPTAVEQARQRCLHQSNVVVRCQSFDGHLPSPVLDLLVLSEIGYYFTPQAWRQMTADLSNSLPHGATVIAAHWLGHSPDHQMGGNQVHQILDGNADLHLTHGERHEDAFRLDVWVRA